MARKRTTPRAPEDTAVAEAPPPEGEAPPSGEAVEPAPETDLPAPEVSAAGAAGAATKSDDDLVVDADTEASLLVETDTEVLVPVEPGEGSGEASPGEEQAPGERPGPARTAPRSVSELHLKGILESLVFVSDKPIGTAELAKIARADARDVRRLLGDLREEYRGRGVTLDEIAGGWQFRSSAANAPFVRELLQARPVKLTRAQVETLAIVAYRQPITRPEIDEVRGVDSGSALKVLLERDLVRMLGRKEEVGRPVLYGTTGQFLEFFGLKSLRDLPTLREFTDLSPESQATLVRAMTDVGAEEPAAGAAPETPAGAGSAAVDGATEAAGVGEETAQADEADVDAGTDAGAGADADADAVDATEPLGESAADEGGDGAGGGSEGSDEEAPAEPDDEAGA